MRLFRFLALSLLFASVPALASAQLADEDTAQPQRTPPISRGPMTVERLHSGFEVTPDVKLTRVDRTTSALVGGSAGWVSDETFFIGGGGYWLANQSSARKMAYGGLVMQWLVRTDERVGFRLKGLVGAGGATIAKTVTELVFQPLGPDGRMNPPNSVQPTLRTTSVRVREEFFVAEPEADLTVRLSKRVRLATGIGYRAISRDHRDGTSLGGVTGSLGITFDLRM